METSQTAVVAETGCGVLIIGSFKSTANSFRGE